MKLPKEIEDKILLQLDFDKVVHLENYYTTMKVYNPKIHTWSWAASNGHLDVIEWLHLNRKEGCTRDAMNFAAHNGHLHIVKWLHENRKEGCTKEAMDWAAGYLEIVKWLHKNRTEGCTRDAMDWAAQNGHFYVVEWLIANNVVVI